MTPKKKRVIYPQLIIFYVCFPPKKKKHKLIALNSANGGKNRPVNGIMEKFRAIPIRKFQRKRRKKKAKSFWLR